MGLLHQKSILVPLFLTILAVLIFLFFRGFADPDEGRYAEIPREMVEDGSWLEMRMLGYRYYEKPPLTYWITAVPIRIFGAKDWAVRIPLLFNGIAIIVIFYWLLNQYWGKHQTYMILLFVLQTVGFISGTGLLITDAYLMLWFALSVISFFKAMEETAAWEIKRIVLLIISAIAAVAGVLTKGFVAIVLPSAILAIWALWMHKKIKIIIQFVLAGLFVWGFALIALVPIFLIIEKHNPGFIKQFIYEEHIARFVGTRAIQLHPEPWYFFLLIIPVLLIPISLFLPNAIKELINEKAWQKDKVVALFLVWAIVVIGFFSISTGKLMSYILPAFPVIAILTAKYGILFYNRKDTLQNDGTNKLWKFGAMGPLLVAIALIPAWFLFYLKLIPGKEAYVPAALSCIALLPILLVLLMVILSRQLFSINGITLLNSGILLSAAILLSPIAGKDFNVLLHINSSFVYKTLAKEMKEKDRIVVFWSYRPALPSYTRHIYKPYQEHNELIYGINLEPERAADLDNTNELKQWIGESNEGRIFGIFEPCDMEKKFHTLNIKTRPVETIPSDPDTIVLEIIRD